VIFGGIGLFRELVKLIYGRLVHIFVSNVEGKYRKFMPWDAHLAELTVHSDSACMGKKYVEVGLRSHFGITIVAIERGRQEIIAPGPEEIFFPGDILIVHGTDEQIEKFSGWIETRQDLTGLDSREFGLAELVIGQKSILCGKTIQEARLREDYSSLLVGAEKGGDRVFSPGSDLKIDVGDVLWLVGKRVDLDRILARFG
jgi:CPA2 family monovalent cation:H+ antiporter-2